MTLLIRALLTIILFALAACSSSAGAPVGTPPVLVTGEPSGPAASSGPSTEGPVTTPDEAAQRVIALDPRFASAGPKNPDLIGGCCFYEATTTANGFQVNVELGWGDCPAGCINRHRWSYSVARDGATTLLSETGDAVPSAFPAGGGSTY